MSFKKKTYDPSPIIGWKNTKDKEGKALISQYTGEKMGYIDITVMEDLPRGATLRAYFEANKVKSAPTVPDYNFKLKEAKNKQTSKPAPTATATTEEDDDIDF